MSTGYISVGHKIFMMYFDVVKKNWCYRFLRKSLT